MRFGGMWKDLGTWNTLTEAMEENVIGEVLLNETCEDVHVINDMNLPVIAMGIKNAVIAVSPEGILISDKEQSSYIKPYVEKIEQPVMFAEKSWGSYRVIDVEKDSMTIKVTLNPGHTMNYHSHERRNEVWTVVRGSGRTVVDGFERSVHVGDIISMKAGEKHTVVNNSDEELQLIEIQMGTDISVEDKQKFDL